MDITKVIKAEINIRKQALNIHVLALPDDIQAKAKSDALIDLADELEQLTTFRSLSDFSAILYSLANHNSEQDLEKLYNQDFVITFNGITTKIPFDVVSYNAIQRALKNIMEEQ